MTFGEPNNAATHKKTHNAKLATKSNKHCNIKGLKPRALAQKPKFYKSPEVQAYGLKVLPGRYGAWATRTKFCLAGGAVLTFLCVYIYIYIYIYIYTYVRTYIHRYIDT